MLSKKYLSGSLPWLYILFSIFLIAGEVKILAQEEANPGMKMVMLYKFAQQIQWENEEEIDTFRIGVFGSEPALLREMKLLESVPLKEKPMQVIRFSRLRDLTSIQILYITKDETSEILRIAELTRGKNTLLISDRCEDQKPIMINLLPLKENKFQFEVNKANIINEKLTVLPELLLGGGNPRMPCKMYCIRSESCMIL